jgi:hypothetical protein
MASWISLLFLLVDQLVDAIFAKSTITERGPHR